MEIPKGLFFSVVYDFAEKSLEFFYNLGIY